MSVFHIPVVHAYDVSKQIPQEKKNFLCNFYSGILPLKNWLRLWQQFKLNMETRLFTVQRNVFLKQNYQRVEA